MSNPKEKRHDREEIINAINACCEKNTNETTLNCVLKAAELLRRMHTGNDSEILDDPEWDLASMLLRLLTCKDEKKIHSISIMFKVMTS